MWHIMAGYIPGMPQLIIVQFNPVRQFGEPLSIYVDVYPIRVIKQFIQKYSVANIKDHDIKVITDKLKNCPGKTLDFVHKKIFE